MWPLPEDSRVSRQEQEGSRGHFHKRNEAWEYDARYDGLHKTHLQHILTAVAINLMRIDVVLTNTPRGKTRQSSFMPLALNPCLQDQAAA